MLKDWQFNWTAMLARALPLAALAPASLAHAAPYNARITLGAYSAQETFTQALDGQTSNDFLALSSRFYLKASDVIRPGVETTFDLRDKHDFFDKLDRERLQLVGNNTFQVRQLSVNSRPSRGALYGTVGRFPIPQAGDANADGVEAGYQWHPSFRSAVFGGLNPRRTDVSYLSLNRDSTIFGTYLHYQPFSESWQRYQAWSSALVGQRVQGHLDRFYWFNQLTHQWDESQIFGLFYLDFVPRIYLQTGHLSYLHQLTPELSATASVSAFDVIEYSRRQGVLERLDPSAYREFATSAKYRLLPELHAELGLSHGLRLADTRTKTELSATLSMPGLFDSHFSVHLGGATRQNFTARDKLGRLGLGYYSRSWEITLDAEYGQSLDETGKTLHPYLGEAGVAYFFSKAMHATFSLQKAGSEDVSILSAFFKLGFRVGNQDPAPLRDGASPKGKL